MFNILIKFPSRERSKTFGEVLKKYIQTQTTDNVLYFITLDQTDPEIDEYIKICDKYKNVFYNGGVSKSKIDACNRNLNDDDYKDIDWQILVLASDDMIPVKMGWDQIISDRMKLNHPDLDGVLWFSDGHTKLNTMCILGKTYYNRFKYIYHPDYISLWSDNHFQEVAELLGKTNKTPHECLFEHRHYSIDSKVLMDPLMVRNQKFYMQDKLTYLRHKKNNFNL
jgi:hypothetical protein